MLPQTQGIIYLAEQRGCSQTEQHRSFHIFNFGSWFNEYRKPFGSLQVFNDDTLRGSDAVNDTLEEDTLILLLPVIGGLQYSDTLNRHCVVEPGQAGVFAVPQGSSFQVLNPYQDDLINFIQVRLKGNEQVYPGYAAESTFDLDSHTNELVPLFSGENDSPVSAYIGRFGGRQECIHRLKDAGKGVFIFILEGVFEVQYRLLQPRDALALWETGEVDFEALSNDAIIFVLEVAL